MIKHLLRMKRAQLQKDLNKWAKTIHLKPGQQLKATLELEIIYVPTAEVTTQSKGRVRLPSLSRDLNQKDWQKLLNAVEDTKFAPIVEYFYRNGNKPVSNHKLIQLRLIKDGGGFDQQLNTFL